MPILNLKFEIFYTRKFCRKENNFLFHFWLNFNEVSSENALKWQQENVYLSYFGFIFLGEIKFFGIAMPRIMSDMVRNHLIPCSHRNLSCLGGGLNYS